MKTLGSTGGNRAEIPALDLPNKKQDSNPLRRDIPLQNTLHVSSHASAGYRISPGRKGGRHPENFLINFHLNRSKYFGGAPKSFVVSKLKRRWRHI
jgi:hypothetical protein